MLKPEQSKHNKNANKMQKFKLTPINTQGRQFIQVSEEKWIDGLRTGNKSGFLEVKPEAAERNLAKLEAGEINVALTDKNSQTGLYEVAVVESETANVESDEVETEA